MSSDSQRAAAVPAPVLRTRGAGGWLRRKRFLLISLAVAVALGYLGYTAFMGAATYYLTVSELLARSDIAFGQQVRVMGMVADGSVQKTPETNTIRFTVEDNTGASLDAAYSGVVPDAFKPGAEVVMEGALDPRGEFQATNLLVKCPSKYEAAPGEEQQEGME